MPDDKLKQLAQAIRQFHACEPKHLETVEVTETFRGKVVWQGSVEVFEVDDHPKAKRCYAWTYEDKATAQPRVAAILGLRLIPSAADAVKVFIMAENRKHFG